MRETTSEMAMRMFCLTAENLSHAMRQPKPCNLKGFSHFSHRLTHRG